MLVLGKNHVSRDQLATLPIGAEATDRFTPISHSHLADLTEQALTVAGFQITDQDHVTARNDLRYFGGFELTRNDLADKDRRLVCGLRNSNDKTFAASICIGNSMLVCENLCFSSEQKLSRRHTRFIMRDLPATVAQCIANLTTEWQNMGERIALYKETGLTLDMASKLAVNLVDSQALPKQKLYDVVNLWRQPELAAAGMVSEDSFVIQEQSENGFVDRFDSDAFEAAVEDKGKALADEFGRGTSLWGLYNAVTESLKGSDIGKLPDRTMKLQSAFDGLVGADFEVEAELLPA